MNRLLCLVIAASAGLVPCGRAAISVKTTGAGPFGFETTPNAAEFSTGALPGGGFAFSTPEQVDAAVATLAASNIVLALPTTATVPPSTSSLGFRHNVTGLFLQSRPASSAACLLLATLQNDSDVPLTSFVLSYDFNLYYAVTFALELPGFRVYYSSTGTPGSWQVIPELSGTESTGRVSTLIAPAMPWSSGQRFYLLWVDDNADTATDPAYTIDNLVIIPSNGAPLITSHPQSREINPGANVTFSSMAVGLPPLSYQWRRDGTHLFARTNSSVLISNAQVSDSGHYDVVVSNGFGGGTSQVARLSVGYRLTVTATGGGEVELQPPGGLYGPDEMVMLTAIPNPGRELRFWSGAVNSSTNPLVLTLTSNTAVTANFGPFTALLELSIEGSGIIVATPSKERYDVGEQVVLSANQSDWWYAFWRWADGSRSNPRTITIGLTNRYAAVFVPITPLETLTYGGLSRTAPVGMPALLVDGEFAIDQLFYKEGPARIEMFTTFSNGSIFYTLDGSEPTLSSTRYQGPFEVRTDVNIWPVAFDSEQTNSVPGYPFVVYFPPRVVLQMRGVLGALLLFWPDYAAEYSLEATSALGPAAVWSPFEGPIVVSDGWITATAATTGGLRFFRLRKP